MKFNDAYLNATQHKRQRRHKPEFTVWHETVGSAESSLNWMMNPKSGVSWDFLIARDGTIYRCLDPQRWYGFHAGVSKARGYISDSTRDEVNQRSIGVEVEGPNDGTPITPAQRDSIIALMIYLRDEANIPLEREYQLAHKEIAPGRKKDPRGFSVDVALQLAVEAAAKQPPKTALDLGALSRELGAAAAFYKQATEELQKAWARVELARKKGDPS